MNPWTIQSAVPGIAWPGLPFPGGAAVLGLLHQFEDSQWCSAQGLLERQRSQLQLLLKHAYETVPFYRSRWGVLPDAAHLSELPLLGRSQIQQEFEQLKSRAVPKEHGRIVETRTSGSTGMPVRVLKTELGELFWRACALRDHAWHRRDLGGRLAAIRLGATPGDFRGWGTATEGLVQTGPSSTLSIATDIDAQLKWLAARDPHYLLTYPSNAAELARVSLERGLRLPSLREVRTIGEQLDPEVRALCRECWRVLVVDVYSTDEAGYIALQCPSCEHYHVQSETVLVEILDERGAPCAAGQTGRVVITCLHNFAMPLIRYEVGDLAEAGAPCACGRGLPVLNRIVGRVRNMLTAPDGKRYWPSLGLRHLPEVPKLRQYQFRQKTVELIEARLVTAAPLTADEESVIRERMLSRLPAGMRVVLAYADRIERGAGGKYEEFLSEIAAGTKSPS